MSQNWEDDVYSSGGEVLVNMQDIEDNFACLKSCFSGASAPSVTLVAGMLWLDTTNKKLKQYSGSGWVEIYNYDTGKLILPLVDGSITASQLGAAAVETAKIKDGNVTSVKIVAGAITTEKIMDSAVTTAKIADANVTYIKLQLVAAGNYAVSMYPPPDSVQVIGNTPTKVAEYKVAQAGTYRCRWYEIKDDSYGAGSQPVSQIWRNGGAVSGAFQPPVWGADLDCTYDIAVIPGDLIQLYGWCSYPPGAAAFSLFRLCASGPCIPPVRQ